MQTLKHTVTNQDVRQMTDAEHEKEQKKRADRRVEIKRPKRKIQFNLQENKVREFRTEDIVLNSETPAITRSAERNVPATPGRLVKLDVALEEAKAGLTSGQEAKHET